MRLRSQMLSNVKFNFQSERKFSEVLWACSCEEKMIESQFHIEKNCPKYSDLRDGLDLDDDRCLVAFFDAVLQRKYEEEDEERTRY